MRKLVAGSLCLFFAISVLIFVCATESFAQRGIKWQGSGGWGMRAQYGRMYNPETVAIIVGEIVAVEEMTPMRGMSHGVHLVVKVDQEDVSVHLGPAWYIENQDIKIEPMDRVEVKGSRITFEGKPAIIAAEVKKGDEVLTLRDENGFPAWSGWKRR
jgi:hypothetical protein